MFPKFCAIFSSSGSYLISRLSTKTTCFTFVNKALPICYLGPPKVVMEIFDPAKLGIACKVPGNVLDTAALLHWHYFDRGEEGYRYRTSFPSESLACKRHGYCREDQFPSGTGDVRVSKETPFHGKVSWPHVISGFSSQEVSKFCCKRK